MQFYPKTEELHFILEKGKWESKSSSLFRNMGLLLVRLRISSCKLKSKPKSKEEK